MTKFRIEDMTFLEFKERMAEDPVIIIPLGSVEIQGPWSPMGDFMLSTAMAAEVAQRTGALLAPTIQFGVAEAFRGVPGGIQIRAETLRLLLRDVVGAFLDHGMKRIVLMNGHTGNHGAINEIIRDIRRERGVAIPWLNLWQAVPARVMEAAFGAQAKAAAGHGAGTIASVYLHYFPEIVRRDVSPVPESPHRFLGLPTGGLGKVRLNDVDVFVPLNILDHCEQIERGDVTTANPEAGRVVKDFIVDTAAALVDAMKAAPLGV